MHSQQRGITLIGFLIVLMVVGFFLFIGIRLFPVYSEYYGARKDLNAVAEEPGVKTKSIAQIREMISRRFYISYIENVKPADIELVKDKGDGSLYMKYEVRKPLAYNLDFVAKFEHTVELTGNAPQ